MENWERSSLRSREIHESGVPCRVRDPYGDIRMVMSGAVPGSPLPIVDSCL